MIAVIDYDVGNVSSIVNMIRRLGGNVSITNSSEEIASADGLILPGVGAFENGMNNLRKRGLVELLTDQVDLKKKPLMGICLGMQLMTEGSEEGRSRGLGWIKGRTRLLQPPQKIKVPHMGWNQINPLKENPLFQELGADHRFYFAHSFFVECSNPGDVLAETEYGVKFPSSVARENIYGVQFHPEKSHRFGMELFNNFLKMAERRC